MKIKIFPDCSLLCIVIEKICLWWQRDKNHLDLVYRCGIVSDINNENIFKFS